MISQIVFYIMAAIVLGTAICVVTMQNLVRSIFLFFASLFGLAGLYVFATADFVAVTQIVIYVGGILVLMLFAFMLSDKKMLEQVTTIQKKGKLQSIVAAVLVLTLLGILLKSFKNIDLTSIQWIGTKGVIHPNADNTRELGIRLMTEYLLPFELISILLLMALIGAAHISRKEPNP